MILYLYIVSVFFVAAGSALILHTERSRDVIEVVTDETRCNTLGMAAIAFGVLLAVASFWSAATWFLFLLAVLITGAGAFLMLGDEDKVISIISAWKGISDMGLRLWGLFLVIIGVAILAWV